MISIAKQLKIGDTVKLVKQLPFTGFSFDQYGCKLAKYVGVNSFSGKYMFRVTHGFMNFSSLDALEIKSRRFLLVF